MEHAADVLDVAGQALRPGAAPVGQDHRQWRSSEAFVSSTGSEAPIRTKALSSNPIGAVSWPSSTFLP